MQYMTEQGMNGLKFGIPILQPSASHISGWIIATFGDVSTSSLLQTRNAEVREKIRFTQK